ncbi:MAG: hypothetical protein M1827_005934 [Pycnora praestabilis]|nr:MAG: hypothetical protein M1827_005934 [Pycnora praestabilis]
MGLPIDHKVEDELLKTGHNPAGVEHYATSEEKQKARESKSKEKFVTEKDNLQAQHRLSPLAETFATRNEGNKSFKQTGAVPYLIKELDPIDYDHLGVSTAWQRQCKNTEKAKFKENMAKHWKARAEGIGRERGSENMEVKGGHGHGQGHGIREATNKEKDWRNMSMSSAAQVIKNADGASERHRRKNSDGLEEEREKLSEGMFDTMDQGGFKPSLGPEIDRDDEEDGVYG